MSVKTYREAIKWLESQTKFRPKTDLTIMQHALELLDLDLSHIKKVHVAGTNGKGSVSHYVKNIIKIKGYKVGIFTSPYVYRFNERMMINDDVIEDDTLVALTQFIQRFNLKMLEVYQETLSFFELLTIMAFKYFYDEKVDYMVIEVGIGGLLDATNVLNYDLSLITSIGYDHMKQLGNTLESIALNKLGILKPGNTLMTTVHAQLSPLFKSYCRKNKVKLIYLNPARRIKSFETFLPFRSIVVLDLGPVMMGMFGKEQAPNCLLAMHAGKYLFKDITFDQLHEAINQTTLPARFEVVKERSGKRLILDGAHNEHAMKMLSQTIKAYEIGLNTHILFASLGDKDIIQMLDIIKPTVKSITLTSFDDPRYQSLRPYQTPEIVYADDMIQAYHDLREKYPKDYIIVTGSIHFVGAFKKHFIRYTSQVKRDKPIKKEQNDKIPLA